MTIDGLLEYWARWATARDDGGLGYGSSRLNVLMGGGVACGSGNNLPYGIDGDAVAMTVNNYIARQRPVMAAIIKQEYLHGGSQTIKAQRVSQQCGVMVSAQNYRVTLHRAVKKMQLHPEIAMLLQKLS
ncbi:molecular chaperone DnaJ [Neisseria dentiae]|uniref:molecular chaperone DnaJ n=1 Tax=Neisseria dentiae TaxID=194197 RepID=UPI00211B7E71|nr:molecular chaperone DnaJ [Neisseria dentiae]MCQ9325533.1 molecular chaperone DnaJ [Neisseria dentiae]